MMNWTTSAEKKSARGTSDADGVEVANALPSPTSSAEAEVRQRDGNL